MSDTNEATQKLHTTVALVLGFSALAKRAVSFGERTYFRLAQSAAEEVAKTLGVTIKPGPEGILMEIPCGGPSVKFSAEDIEGMRQTVWAYDREHAVSDEVDVPDPNETPKAWSREAAYDTKIGPLMTQIIAASRLHRIPMFATFNYSSDEDGANFVTTSIPFDDRENNEVVQRLVRTVMAPKHPTFAITVSVPKPEDPHGRS
jgi:hypothetical protein